MKQNETPPDVRVKQRRVMLCRTPNKEIKNKVALGRNWTKLLKKCVALLFDLILHAFS